MKSHERAHSGKGGLELIEEAVHLLRRNPGGTLVYYYAGSLPFVLGLLFFWADMSLNAFGRQHLAAASLAMAIGFLWMKFWQTLFSRNVRAHISLTPEEPWTFRRCLRVLVIQAALQPTGLIVLPFALLPAAIPFGWVYAFYQNVTVLTDGKTGEAGAVFKAARRQCIFWPRQNLVIIGTLFAFGFYVFLNLASVSLFLPGLFKMLLGINSVYTQRPSALLNTTFFAGMLGLAYLCVDPIIKTVYALRCFYAESVQSGEDLKTELKRISISERLVLTAMIALLSFDGTGCLAAADIVSTPSLPAPAVAPAIPAPTLDRAIDQVIHQPKYAWRLPRERTVINEADGPFMRFFQSAGDTLKRWMKAAWHWLRDLWHRWFKSNAPPEEQETGGGDWIGPLQMAFFVILTLVACALVIFIFRAFRQYQRPVLAATSQAIFPAPDLADENTGAEQLPEDGWTQLGRELLARGELRLALRAFYFASLAHLAARNLITIAKFKSNHDYGRELRRRGHALPALPPLFEGNVLTFERSWYGHHEVDPEMVEVFVANVEKLKANG